MQRLFFSSHSMFFSLNELSRETIHIKRGKKVFPLNYKLCRAFHSGERKLC